MIGSITIYQLRTWETPNIAHCLWLNFDASNWKIVSAKEKGSAASLNNCWTRICFYAEYIRKRPKFLYDTASWIIDGSCKGNAICKKGELLVIDGAAAGKVVNYYSVSCSETRDWQTRTPRCPKTTSTSNTRRDSSHLVRLMAQIEQLRPTHSSPFTSPSSTRMLNDLNPFHIRWVHKELHLHARLLHDVPEDERRVGSAAADREEHSRERERRLLHEHGEYRAR